MSEGIFDIEIDTYNRELPRLLKEGQEYRYAVIVGEELIDTFGDISDAMRDGMRRYGTSRLFMIKQIREYDPPLYFPFFTIRDQHRAEYSGSIDKWSTNCRDPIQ